MQKLMARFTVYVAFVLLLGCASTDDLAGTWLSDAGENRNADVPRTLLTLEPTGGFIAENFPISVACPPSESSGVISGAGKWEFDASQARIHLFFSEYSKPACIAPHGAVVFVENVMLSKKILLFPKGMDKPSSAISLEKRK